MIIYIYILCSHTCNTHTYIYISTIYIYTVYTLLYIYLWLYFFRHLYTVYCICMYLLLCDDMLMWLVIIEGIWRLKMVPGSRACQGGSGAGAMAHCACHFSLFSFQISTWSTIFIHLFSSLFLTCFLVTISPMAWIWWTELCRAMLPWRHIIVLDEVMLLRYEIEVQKAPDSQSQAVASLASLRKLNFVLDALDILGVSVAGRDGRRCYHLAPSFQGKTKTESLCGCYFVNHTESTEQERKQNNFRSGWTFKGIGGRMRMEDGRGRIWEELSGISMNFLILLDSRWSDLYRPEHSHRRVTPRRWIQGIERTERVWNRIESKWIQHSNLNGIWHPIWVDLSSKSGIRMSCCLFAMYEHAWCELQTVRTRDSRDGRDLSFVIRFHLATRWNTWL